MARNPSDWWDVSWNPIRGCTPVSPGCDHYWAQAMLRRFPWVIAGPETGPGARPCEPKWIEDLAEQCQKAGVPFWDKRKEGWIRRERPKGW